LERVGDRRAQVIGLVSLARTDLHLGNYEAAGASCDRGLALVESIGGLATLEVHLCIAKGRACEALADLTGAHTLYTRALHLAESWRQPDLVILAQGHLAHLALSLGDVALACSYVNAVMDSCAADSRDRFFDAVVDSFQLALFCYEVLRTVGDPRAEPILLAAHEHLLARVAKLGRAELRSSCIENIPAHRQLLAEVAQLQAANLSSDSMAGPNLRIAHGSHRLHGSEDNQPARAGLCAATEQADCH
jgi:hypothetical protein